MNELSKKVIVALDTIDIDKITYLLKELRDYVEIFKIGLQSFIFFGPDIIKKVKVADYKVFLDLKLHDIPNTVQKAVESALKHDIDMLTIHIVGGDEMIKNAVEMKKKVNSEIKLLGVTVLTSHNENSLEKLKYSLSLEDLVLHFANIGKTNGLDGVVCSPKEIKILREKFGKDFLLVTPGIRIDKSLDDQKRTLTPKEAFEAGADYIVVGRPILDADNPKIFFENLR
jgi:orotidine-5'-phosphate decarboxylase